MIGTQDIEDFFKTLLLGDFVEDQNTAGQIVGGLIAMIPVLEQVMVARDVSGALFNINKRGGFAHADTTQVVNLGFAAFGAVPEVGEAFKTVFKPLWKERSLARGAVHGGLEAIEKLLGMRKGGAITFVREELIGKWGSWVQRSIVAANMALDACIALMEFIATADGWENWLVPSSIQALAQQTLPSLKSFKGKLNDPMTRAGNEIQEFLKDLIGEQAAAVVVAVTAHVVAASIAPATRTKSGHNAADEPPKGHIPPRQETRKVGAKPEAEARKGSGPLHSSIQLMRKAFADLEAREKGLIGEHMVDYHEAKRLGGSWPHDQPKGAWSPETIRKINVDKRPVNLSLVDLPKVNHAGIDAVWDKAGAYTVTEAKASASIAAAYGFGAYKEKKGLIPTLAGLNPDLKLLHYLLSDSADKAGQGYPLMQMSRDWVADRAPKESLPSAALASIRAKTYERRTVLVTFESSGAVDHAKALADVQLLKPAAEVQSHADHGVTREWDATAIDTVTRARAAAHQSKTEADAGSAPAPAKSTRKIKPPQ